MMRQVGFVDVEVGPQVGPGADPGGVAGNTELPAPVDVGGEVVLDRGIHGEVDLGPRAWRRRGGVLAPSTAVKRGGGQDGDQGVAARRRHDQAPHRPAAWRPAIFASLARPRPYQPRILMQ